MNRKITLLLLATVTAILPAVAVADVMITGSVNMVGTQNTAVFYVQPGCNYNTAHAVGSIVLNPQLPKDVASNATESSFWYPPNSMATVDLQGINNQTTVLANVLDLNVTVAAGVTATLTITFTANFFHAFPLGTMVFITKTPLNVNFYPGDGWIGGQSINSGHFTLSGFHAGVTTYYISFVLPPGNYVGDSATMTGAFVAT